MSDAITQCPACQASFRVTPGQLDVADGSVRCGACLNIFQAEDHFLSPSLDQSEKALIQRRYWADFDEYVTQTDRHLFANAAPLARDEPPNEDLEANHDTEDSDDGSDVDQHDVGVVFEAESESAHEASHLEAVSQNFEVIIPDDSHPENSSLVDGPVDLPDVVESVELPVGVHPLGVPQIVVPSDAAIAAAKRSLAGEDVAVVRFWDPLNSSMQASAGVPSMSSPRKHLVGFSEPQTSDNSASPFPPKIIEVSSNASGTETLGMEGDVTAEFLEFVWFHSSNQPLVVSAVESKRNASIDAEENYDEYRQFVGPSGEVNNESRIASVEVLDSTALERYPGATYLSELRDPDDGEASLNNPRSERDEEVFSLDLTEDVVLADAHRRHRRLELKWLPGIFLLLLISFAQYAYFNMDRYAQFSEYRGWYGHACRLLPCKLPTYRNYSQLVTKDLVIRLHPDEESALLLDVLLLNAADDRQEFPRLRLNFFDINGGVVATRDFEVNEYLGGELRGLRFIPAVTEVRLSLALKDPGRAALGYEMVVVEL